MVDTAPQPAAAPVAPSAAATPVGPPLGGAPSSTQILQDQRAPQRADVLGGLRGLLPGSEAPAAQPSTATAAAGSQQASAANAAPGTGPAAAVATDPATGAAAAQPSQAPIASPAPDPAAAAPTSEPPTDEHPGMAQVRKAEQHMRAKLADERAQALADLERQKAVWTSQLNELDRYKALLASARQDPLALLAAAGFGEADYEPLAQLAYAMSPEGQKDPRVAQGRKIAAHESLARRAQQTEQERMRSEIAALRDEQAKRDAQAAAEQNVQRYLQTVTRAVGETSPHVRYAMTRAPETTQQYLLAVADRLYQGSGPSNDLRDIPAPEQVLKAYEQERAAHIRDVLAELEALGIDPRAYGKPAAPAHSTPAAAGNVPPAATAGHPANPAAAVVAAAAAQPAAPATSLPAEPRNEDDKRRMALEELRKLRFAG